MPGNSPSVSPAWTKWQVPQIVCLHRGVSTAEEKKTTTEDVNSPESLWSVFSLHSSFSAASSVENKKTWSIQNVSNCSFYTEEHEDQEKTKKTMFGTTPINHSEINSEKWRYSCCRWLYSDWIWSHRLGTVVSAATWQPINMEAGWSRKWGQSRRLPKTKQSVSEAYATSCLPDPSVSTQAEYSQKKEKERKNSGGGGSAQSRNCLAFGFYPPLGGGSGGGEKGNTRLLLLCTCPHARLLLALISPVISDTAAHVGATWCSQDKPM